jgi:hypothetical protein
MFEALDFVYVPTADVDAVATAYVDTVGAELLWKVKAMNTTVAALRVSAAGPQILLSGHLQGERPVLVYRVASYVEAVETLRAAGITDLEELEIPHGPCAAFRVAGGDRFAVYERVRPRADDYFVGRIDS